MFFVLFNFTKREYLCNVFLPIQLSNTILSSNHLNNFWKKKSNYMDVTNNRILKWRTKVKPIIFCILNDLFTDYLNILEFPRHFASAIEVMVYTWLLLPKFRNSLCAMSSGMILSMSLFKLNLKKVAHKSSITTQQHNLCAIVWYSIYMYCIFNI